MEIFQTDMFASVLAAGEQVELSPYHIADERTMYLDVTERPKTDKNVINYIVAMRELKKTPKRRAA